MVGPTTINPTGCPPLTEDEESDYGSDIGAEEEHIVNELLSAWEQRLDPVQDNPIVAGIEYHELVDAVRVPRANPQERRLEVVDRRETAGEDIDTAADNPGQAPQTVSRGRASPRAGEVKSEPRNTEDEDQDVRSPIERFRTAPSKSLSVTDLVSPAWCEIQYWYTLKHHGRKRATPEMKKGSKIHKKLEDQLYDTVQVNIATKEDGWGLRLWNVIQGLRTLEKIGYTRELEVWGMIDGIPVNGVVDEVTIDCPDKELEARLDNRSNHGVKPLPAGQATLEQYLAGNGSTLHASTEAAESSSSRSTRRKIYICDVKTRSARSLPNAVAFRPTKMQLMLYHRLLGSLASNEVDFSILLGRYGLDGNRPFSDAFIAQIGNLDVTAAGEPHASSQSSQSSLDLFLENNSLTQLWSLMIATFQRVLPLGKQSLGRVLRAEYRSRDNGEVLGSRTLAMDDQVLDLYLNHELKWWKGERDPLGVVMEEAYKCNSCEFADLCDWRIARVEEAREKSRANKKAMKEVKKWEV